MDNFYGLNKQPNFLHCLGHSLGFVVLFLKDKSSSSFVWADVVSSDAECFVLNQTTMSSSRAAKPSVPFGGWTGDRTKAARNEGKKGCSLPKLSDSFVILFFNLYFIFTWLCMT